MGFDYRDPVTRFYLLFLLLILHTVLVCSQPPNNTISQGQFMRDGQSIISPGKYFELGFFSPPNSTARYAGIWYYGIAVQTVVWVANRDNPISGNSGLLGVGNDGNLKVTDGKGVVLWSTNTSSSSRNNSTAVLLDSGNLILSNGGDNVTEFDEVNALWQSYEHPADTYLFNMRIHIQNALRGQKHAFVSWKGASDPSNGDCVMGMDPRAAPQIVTWNGSQRIWRSGHWNGKVFLGVPSFRTIFSYNYKLTKEPNGNSYFTFEGVNTTALMNFRMQWNGVVEQLNWDEGGKNWKVRLQEPSNECGQYNKCGNFAICSMTGANRCSCMDGFVAKYEDQWTAGNWSGGCVRRTPLKCGTSAAAGAASSDDVFVHVDRTKLPDHADLTTDNAGDCENGCLKNCSCIAYAFVDGIGCMTWEGALVDVVEQSQVGGGTLNIRVARSDLAGGGKSSLSTIATIIIALLGTIFLCVFIWLLWRFRGNLRDLSIALCKDNKPLIVEFSRSHHYSMDIEAGDEHSSQGKGRDAVPLPLFSFQSVEVATENFSDENKLGQGGFGPVYKGILPGGQEIAVKRLSRLSGQGVEEFKNELILIAELQHRNLVRLRGCCVEGEEKLLVYEYMPNKSLDWFLFDPLKKAQLDWRIRFKIIEGIARGLLYLHRDSRLRIIHRDLKVSNILLDEEMNPKISDFGMARIFGGNQNEANTNRVVGTYGYMSPEYAMEGLFSVKSDVYSFGVLLLEIVSGQRNNSFRSEECSNLIRYAWYLWKEGKAEELIDPTILKTCDTKEALQCIHVGMLCVQISALDRPTMASVVVMLESEKVNFPEPNQPDFTSMKSVEKYLVMQGHDTTTSNNDVTITQLDGEKTCRNIWFIHMYIKYTRIWCLLNSDV